MQFQGYQISNLKSYRKYFCFADVARALENGAYRDWLYQMLPVMERQGGSDSENYRLMKEIGALLGVRMEKPEETVTERKADDPGTRKVPAETKSRDAVGTNHRNADAQEVSRRVAIRTYLFHGLSDSMSYEETAAGILREIQGDEDDRVDVIMEQWKTAEMDVQGAAGSAEEACSGGVDVAFRDIRHMRLLFLVHELARTIATDVPALAACLRRMTGQDRRQAGSPHAENTGGPVSITTRTYLLRRHPAPFRWLTECRTVAEHVLLPENGIRGCRDSCKTELVSGRKRFEWRQLRNDTDHPVVLLLAEQDTTAEVRCLNPGGSVWYLALDDCFVRWGGRIQVHHESFACADRQGRLVVNGHVMKGGGLVQLSLDEKSGILGVDEQGQLRQYSSLAPGPQDGMEAVLAYLNGEQYWVLCPDGGVVTNMEQMPQDWILAQTGLLPPAVVLPQDFPFLVFDLSVSLRLLGFETMDGRVGVWDRKQNKLIWMEE